MDKKKQLEKQVKAFERKCQSGDAIKLNYEGKCIATYKFTEWSFDAKTPSHWLQQCLCFEISLEGRDINKVELETIYK